MHDHDWLAHAIDLATRNVAEGGGPFGAVVVRAGELVAVGTNRVTLDLDPSAHAEVTAIRAACAATGDYTLAGCTLYASCEPCPMCLATSLWARLDRLVYAADRQDAADAGFDDAVFYDLFTVANDPDLPWPCLVEQLRVDTALAPFDAWRAAEGRRPY